MLDLLRQPWPWYIAGPIIGLAVPALLLLGNKSFGVSSTLRHICAACFPANISFFKYDWKREIWNLFFSTGILIGGMIAAGLLANPDPVNINAALSSDLAQYGITDLRAVIPQDVMNWNSLFSLKGFLLIIGGGFLVGFGTRYAGGCTSGHSIMGLSNLQWPSLVATCCFMLGGILMTNFVIKFILSI